MQVWYKNRLNLDAYTTDDIKYEWKAENPIQQKDGLRQSLPSFELQDVLTDYCTSKTNTGQLKFLIRRTWIFYNNFSARFEFYFKHYSRLAPKS